MPVTSNGDFDHSDVTIAVLTNGRPHSLKGCLESVTRNIGVPCKTVILDSTPETTSSSVLSAYTDIYREYPKAHLLKFSDNVPPGAARKILSRNAETPYILFLDDDVTVEPCTLRKLVTASRIGDFDVMAGVLFEKWGPRPGGFAYSFGQSGDEEFVLKSPIFINGIENNITFRVHDVPSTILCKVSLFDKVQFDENYDFFFELFDFFLQCFYADARVGVVTGANFRHHPLPYNSKSSRQLMNKDIDRQRFIEKWNKIPLFATDKIPDSIGKTQRNAVNKTKFIKKALKKRWN